MKFNRRHFVIAASYSGGENKWLEEENRRMKCAPRLEKRKNDGLKTDLKPLDLEANKIEGVLKSADSSTFSGLLNIPEVPGLSWHPGGAHLYWRR